MIIYSDNKLLLEQTEKAIHLNRNKSEPLYKCNKWADILKHNLKDEFAIYIDEAAFKSVVIPKGCELINELPLDFYPKIEEIF